MECAASTEVPAAVDLPFDTDAAYALDPAVAIRPEPFGALAYHYGNRRLTFLRSPDLVALVRDLEHHDSADAALAASTIEPARWPAFRKALASLSDAEVLRAR
jgi:putative mycofactocin binding protein MftB